MTEVDADTALEALRAGNLRHQAGAQTHPHLDAGRRRELLRGQHPWAIVLCCSDSRVPPEHVFDQGLGDLFVVRVAGNVLSDTVAATLEYAVEHLRAPLLVVLGHQHCGAVKATLDALAASERLPGRLHVLHDAIAPAVAAARDEGGGDDGLHDAAARVHIRRTVTQLQLLGPFLSARVSDGSLRIVGAYYELATGAVEWLGGAGHGETAR